MPQFLSPIINDQQEDANGNPLIGGKIFVYLAGTSTLATTYNDKDGLPAHANTNPIILNSLGVNNQGPVWLVGGASYKFVIQDSAGVLQRTIDNVTGINDQSIVTTDQWVLFAGAPTFVSTTSFTVAGDQTQIFQPRRRVKTQNTGGIALSTIVNSVFSTPNTTVTVANDSVVLDAGLSAVSYGLISTTDSSLAGGFLITVRTIIASGTFTPTPGATRWFVEGYGSGGAGGGCNAVTAGNVSVGGGGASGAVGSAWITSSLFPSLAVTIGAGGAGAAGGTGGTGGSSGFGTLLTLPGGTGGAVGANAAVSAASGGAAVAAAGSVPLLSSSGTAGMGAIASFAAGYVASGAGGSTKFGAGGQPVVTGGTTAAGNSALGRGAGGGGAAGIAGGVAAAGGAGTPGIFIVYEYQ